MKEFLSYAHVRMTPTEFFRAICAGGAALLTAVFGGADRWLIALVVAVIADYISGVIAAYFNKELSSKRGFAGILKKTLLFSAVAVANVADTATGAGGVLRSLAIGFLFANEGISVLENCSRCGIPMPHLLINALEQLRGERDPDVEKPPDGEDPDPDEPYDGDGSGD